MSDDPLVIYRHWEKTALDLFDRTLKFPKAVRLTFTNRVDNLTLDILEALVVARYRKGARRRQALDTIDLKLARMRVLLRLCHARRYLDHKGFEFVSRNLDEAGRMVGGWLKTLDDRGGSAL